ncbi:DUF4265 domain-containing protein [Flammeovirga aprica]|uniref:DUF4265 domain-containing protein n=1 Tax=Flammeovirga aprica JL-4 TaxID=694437 RepID=A0A7X9XDG0_9BACT|nr:DUF4265 domain-containing protein [Flammeovirga aprica]NME72760.1 DUF4265 domain-containing protein [Flammeovirga aprica JL-4]
MKSYKINLVVEGVDDTFFIESVWAEKEGDHYRIDNIPFYASNIALGDLVSVEYDSEEDALYFEDFIKVSGNSVIRIIFFKLELKDKICNALEQMGCLWEGSDKQSLISVSIGKDLDYDDIMNYIKNQFSLGNIDYEEACIGHTQ